ncbi:gamma-glutamyl kinase, partial [Pseudooctadecabacter sp.]|uniref:gamma-glutamyl kinase n=1 Tax=Pseudooctadecabacter sp. TaxID=1966338 RepID=UPI0025E38AF1
MLVFAKEKLVFLAAPKTGTTALEGALAPHADVVMRNPPILKHTPAYRYHLRLRPYFEVSGLKDLSLVCALREPVSWLGSWYRYRQRPDLDGAANSTRDVTFDRFVDEYCKGAPAPFSDTLGYPPKFIRQTDDIIVDHLFQYEQMDKLVAFFEERLDVSLNLKQINVSPAGNLDLSAKTEAKLRRKRAQMFDDWE